LSYPATVAAGVAVFLAALAGALFAAFLTAFFGVVVFAAAFAALTAAQRFLTAAMIFRLPAELSFRLGFGASAGTDGADSFFAAAHRLR
jgi:hypothetical protein